MMAGYIGLAVIVAIIAGLAYYAYRKRDKLAAVDQKIQTLFKMAPKAHPMSGGPGAPPPPPPDPHGSPRPS